tara:strand:+ start:447 stop:608 length:162 start_codon:yes stop_codon:yes gene_type:complete
MRMATGDAALTVMERFSVSGGSMGTPSVMQDAHGSIQRISQKLRGKRNESSGT